MPPPAANADGDRTGKSAGAAVAELGRLLQDRVDRVADEVGELDFRHGPEADHRCADGGGDDDAFGERRIENAFLAEFLDRGRRWL